MKRLFQLFLLSLGSHARSWVSILSAEYVKLRRHLDLIIFFIVLVTGRGTAVDPYGVGHWGSAPSLCFLALVLILHELIQLPALPLRHSLLGVLTSMHFTMWSFRRCIFTVLFIPPNVLSYPSLLQPPVRKLRESYVRTYSFNLLLHRG